MLDGRSQPWVTNDASALNVQYYDVYVVFVYTQKNVFSF